MSKMQNTPVLPQILTANTYFWRSGSSASQRRSNEKRHTETVESFLRSNGFDITVSNGEDVIGERDGVKVHFSYRESCKNVYKHLKITRNGKRSNIRALKKLLAQ